MDTRISKTLLDSQKHRSELTRLLLLVILRICFLFKVNLRQLSLLSKEVKSNNYILLLGKELKILLNWIYKIILSGQQ